MGQKFDRICFYIFQYVDLTSEQFGLYSIKVNYEPNQTVDRKYCGKNKNTNDRYQMLVNNIMTELNNKDDES